MGAEEFAIDVNGRPVAAHRLMSVAAALLTAGVVVRHSVTGEPRAPFCGMGVCFECVATIDGEPLVRACQTLCRPGMKVSTR